LRSDPHSIWNYIMFSPSSACETSVFILPVTVPICWLLWPLLTSFSAFAQLGSPSVRRIPVDLLLLDLLHRLQTHWDFGVVCHLIQSVQPHIQFPFVRTGLCSLGYLSAWITPNHSRWNAGQVLRLANASGVTPRMRDFHSLGVLSVERTFIFAIQGAHTGLAKVAVQYSAESLVVNQTLVLRINPVRTGWWKSPNLVAANRLAETLKNDSVNNETIKNQ